jgi:putative drug exporter of the RND superfamily
MTQHDVFGALGRLCYRHRRWVIWIWVVAVVCGVAAGLSVFGRLSDDNSAGSSESAKGFGLAHVAGIGGDSVVGIVSNAPVAASATKRAVTAAATAVIHLPHVRDVRDAYNVHDAGLISKDRRASLVIADLDDNMSDSDETALAEEIRDRLTSMPIGTVIVGGDALMWPEFRSTAQGDAERGEAFAFPVALIAMVFVFGGLVAAAIPLLSAFVAMAGSLMLILVASYVTNIASYSVNIVTMLGLGLAIDYSLLAVSRFREERDGGLSIPDAVERTAATAGRTIAFSAMTVIASFAGLLVFNSNLFRSLAIGGIGVITIGVLAALTLTPALLGAWGPRIRPRRTLDQGRFSRLAAWVAKRPVPIVLVLGLGLLAAGTPFLHVRYNEGGPKELPPSSQVRQVAERLTSDFPTEQVDPVHVIALAPMSSPGLVAYERALRARHDVVAVSAVGGSFHNRDGTVVPVTNISVVPPEGSQSLTAQALVRSLRADRPEMPTFVSGDAAYLVDFKHAISHSLPWAVLLVVVATMLLLFLMTGSVLIPIKALVMNFLSLGATFGVLVAVFQDGHLARFIGASTSGALETVVPLLVFVFAFGLSMDYEVFLISRVKELVDEGYDNQTAVERALQRSGRIITSAAVLIVIVFIGFATARATVVKEMGVALSTAVIVDVTLVRCLLVPATMSLLGELNWWAPRWLRRLHAHVGIREHLPVPSPAVVAAKD